MKEQLIANAVTIETSKQRQKKKKLDVVFEKGPQQNDHKTFHC